MSNNENLNIPELLETPATPEVPEVPELPEVKEVTKAKGKGKAKVYPECKGCKNPQPCRNQLQRPTKVKACASMHGLTAVS